MKIQEHLIKFVSRSNWVLLCVAGFLGLVFAPVKFALGIIAGGLIVTVNFHLLYRTLQKAFQPPHLISPGRILAKYYLRFVVTAIIIFFLISGHYVHPIGLFIGLSVVVVSIILATFREVKKLIFEEAV